MRCAGRIALVTGGSAGIGRAIVQRLVKEGARVAFCGSNPARLDAEGVVGAHGLVADVGDPEAVAALFADVRRRWGGVDILVNNAAMSPKRRSDGPWILQADLAEWRRVLDVNLTGAFLCAREAARDMMARRFGRIVNIGSIAGRTLPKRAGPHYAASKAGLAGLTRSLAFDLAGYGITANCIAPGWIATGMTTDLGSPEGAARALPSIPVGRIGQPDDIAGLVAYLASEEAGFVTGGQFDVNGGGFAA